MLKTEEGIRASGTGVTGVDSHHVGAGFLVLHKSSKYA